jgi:hypothetical protein
VNSPGAHSAKHEEKPEQHAEFNTAELIEPRRRLSWKVMVPIWIGLITLVVAAYYRNWDARVVGGGALVIALLTNAIAWLAATIGLVPILGPLIVKILALPFIWLLNGIGYIISMVAIRRGFSKDVLTYRGLTIALIVGIVIGYVVGKFV